jgi:photosystem II stability/assembly factor-like uncharacterized protein
MKFNFIITTLCLFALTLNAQWDTLHTGYNLRYEAIDFKDANNGVVIGNDVSAAGTGYILVTVDGGISWSTSPLPYQLERHDVDYAPSGNYWVVGDSGRVIYLGWPTSGYLYQGYISQRNLYCGFVLNDSVFYCGGEGGTLLRTLNSGSSWDTLASGTLETINDVYFSNPANGWIVADGGYLAMTTDSGNTWTFANQPFWGFRDLNSLSYQGSTGLNPYVVGTSGSGMYSTDGGTSWFQFATNTGEVLNAVQFGTTNSGIICGAHGFVSRSSNGGGNWNTDVVPRTVDYYDVSFGSDSVAYICGDSGVVLKSTVDVSGISENNYTSNLNAFPNPASEQLYLELNSEAPATFTIRILDITGKEVQSSQNTVAGGRQIVQVKNFSELANGVYFITVSNANGTATTKVVKN